MVSSCQSGAPGSNVVASDTFLFFMCFLILVFAQLLHYFRMSVNVYCFASSYLLSINMESSCDEYLRELSMPGEWKDVSKLTDAHRRLAAALLRRFVVAEFRFVAFLCALMFLFVSGTSLSIN